MASSSLYQIEKLDENNFETWSVHIKSVLIHSGYWRYVNGDEKKIATWDAGQKLEWVTADEKALATIMLRIKTSQINYIKNCTTSNEAWLKLKEIYKPNGPIQKVSLYKRLLSLNMKENNNMVEYLNTFFDIVEKLNEVGIQLQDELLVIILLSSLPKDYENFVMIIETRDVLPSFSIIKLKLLEEAERRNNQELEGSTTQQAFGANLVIKMHRTPKILKVMLLIFEKTVSEPNFAPTYKKFSKVLFEDVKAESKKVFNALLMKRLQTEFEINVNNADAKERKLQQIINKLKETKDQQEKIELQGELEHQEYQFRRRAWGTVRFIGEMYKLHSLTADRVLQCVESLLEHGSEEKLEYMCKLLTTVGNLLESNNLRMNNIFVKIQTIVIESREPGNKKTIICSRVLFMMQDLIDLRSRNWGQSANPHSSHIVRRQPEDRNSKISSASLNSYDSRASSQRMSTDKREVPVFSSFEKWYKQRPQQPISKTIRNMLFNESNKTSALKCSFRSLHAETILTK